MFGACRFTREVVQKRRALISQPRETETDFPEAQKRKKDFVDIILLSKVREKKRISIMEDRWFTLLAAR